MESSATENPFAARLAAESNGPESTPKAAEAGNGGAREVIPVGPKGVEFKNVESMFRFARCYLQSGLAPNHIKREQQLVIIWAKGLELGLSPMQAVEDLIIVNNQPTMRVDLQLALVEGSGKLRQKSVAYSGENSDLVCTITLQRKGRKSQDYSFSMKEARTAGLADKQNWRQYPQRMVYQRALGFALRGEFADILKGIKPTEEVEDYTDISGVENSK